MGLWEGASQSVETFLNSGSDRLYWQQSVSHILLRNVQGSDRVLLTYMRLQGQVGLRTQTRTLLTPNEIVMATICVTATVKRKSSHAAATSGLCQPTPNFSARPIPAKYSPRPHRRWKNIFANLHFIKEYIVQNSS